MAILFAVIAIVLGIVTVKQNEVIKHLQTKNMTLQKNEVVSVSSHEEQAAPKTDEQGSAETLMIDGDFYFVVRRLEFSFGGATGTVTQVCQAPLTINGAPIAYGVACAENNILFMDLEGKRTVITEFKPERFDETATLNDIVVVGTNLLVSFNHDFCAYIEGLCGYYKQITYRVSLPDRKVHPLQTDIIGMGSFKQFAWNPNSTKGVVAVGCFEGCPEETYQGIDLVTGKTILLLKYSDLIGKNNSVIPKAEDIIWKDNDTVTIQGKDYDL